GTDAIDESGGAERAGAYNPVRGARVIAYAKAFLDRSVPLTQGSYADVTALTIEGGRLRARLGEATFSGLADAAQLVGWQGDPAAPRAILLRRNGLHLEIQIDRSHRIGAGDAAGIKDVLLEAAL